MATKETVKLTNVLFGEKTFSAIEQNVGADADSLGEVINGNKNIDVVKSNDKLLIGVDSDNAAAGTVLTALGDGTSTWAAMPGGGTGPVTGITVDGTELPIEEGSVALPIVTDTSESMSTGDSALGICKILPNSMLYASGGAIDVKEANQSGIAQRSSAAGDVVLTAPLVNDIVKAALTDENRISGLTEEEKKNACTVLGATRENNYELIEEITLTENVDSIARTTDTQGNAYNFKAILIYAKFSANTDNSSIQVYVNGFGDMACNAQNIIGTSSKFAKIDISCNREVISANVIHSSSPAGTAYVVSEPYFFVGHSAITGVELVATKGIPSGSTIKIYGVRA